MTKRYRLTARAQMHGEVREPGYEFTLADGEVGPHRTVVAANVGAQIADHLNAGPSGLTDVPLYVEVTDKPEAEAKAEPDTPATHDGEGEPEPELRSESLPAVNFVPDRGRA